MSIRHERSRPTRSLRTSPASSKIRRCFVTAWRERLVPRFNWIVGRGPLSLRRATIAKRTGSPSAAKVGAASGNGAGWRFRPRLPGLALLLAGKVLLDEPGLVRPALVVGLEGL